MIQFLHGIGQKMRAECFKKFWTIIPEVRRCILEAAVRAPMHWHSAAVRAAFASEDANWQCTAVFCMQYIKGFDQQILDALKSERSDIRYEAILAAGHWELAEAWPIIARLAADPGIDKPTLLAVIDAAANIGLPESVIFLDKLLYSDDDDIVDAAHEALGMLGGNEFDDMDD